ncbi:MAG TPA: flagellar hook protein FlgE [Alphaproteobacteria bacterium]|nr:flagellar hook protein FlgE [Alphaproteobacteria bacterium]
MSLFGALFTGVSALSSQSQSMAMISNNIANVNTVGYKRVYADFTSLVTGSGSGTYAPGGVQARTLATTASQGILQQTSNATDIAISGNGFFVVRREPNDTQEVLYSRAGSFSEDNSGYMRNTAGMVLYGWPLDSNGEIPASNSNIGSLVPVNVSFLGGQTKATTSATLALNLNAGQATGATAPHFTREITVYDTLGSAQTLSLEFVRTGTNAWTMDVKDGNGDSLLPDTTTVPDGIGDPVTVTFSSDGSIDEIAGVAATSLSVAGISWGNGSSTQTIDLNLANLTQFDADYNVVNITQNGAELGLRTGVQIDRYGKVFATFSNGTTAQLFQLPLATFANPNGLKEQSGNAYSITTESGDYNLREAGASGSGLVAPNSLEGSNVDLADEFSKMIITQRAYSAGTKVITTADQMLQELLQTR